MERQDLPFVSIVMPIRNESGYIKQTIDSILVNDYPADKMEIIVTDGCSDDGTQDIVREMGGKDSRVILMENKGRVVSTGLNMGLKACRGDIFIRIDGHCEIAPDFILKSVKCLQDHPEAWVVGGYWKTISQGYIGKTVAAATQSSIGVGNARHRLGNYDGWTDTVPYGAHHMWIFDRIGYFDEELVRNQDDEFNMRVILGGGKIWITSAICSIYYSRSSIGKLWRQYFQYGFWRIRTMQKHKGPAVFRQIVPLLFVLDVLILTAAAIIFPILWPVWFVFAGLYILGLLYGTYDVWRQAGFKSALIAPLIFAILHFGYGFGSLWGVVRFILFRGRGIRKPSQMRLTR